jgi:hypothetical protein
MIEANLELQMDLLEHAHILAGYFPSWKATRIGPMVALRHE